MGRERAVSGDVVGHELTEEGPASGDSAGIVTSFGVDHRSTITSAAGIAYGPEQGFLGEEWWQLGKEPPVGVSPGGRVDRPRRRQAMVASRDQVSRHGFPMG